MPNAVRYMIGGFIALVLILLSCVLFSQRVPVGNVAVATLFGDIKGSYKPGLHFPVNPLLSFTYFDVRQKTLKENIAVPSRDQLTTSMDISIQYRADASSCEKLLADTGNLDNAVAIHLIPLVRSVAREQGKSVAEAEMFFLEETQAALQGAILENLGTKLADKGVIVQDVLIREVQLPTFVLASIEKKKVRAQQAEEQKAELERFKVEEEQKAVTAAAEKLAAAEEADKIKLLADAKAYEIKAVNEAVAGSPGYIQIEALKTLQAISKDPAAKMYFMDGGSPTPLPLMHLGVEQGK